MSVKIRLKRMGKKKQPYYRIVVMDSRSPRDGRAIDELGSFKPVEKENQVSLKEDKLKFWMEKGAKPSPTVKQILNKNKITL